MEEETRIRLLYESAEFLYVHFPFFPLFLSVWRGKMVWASVSPDTGTIIEYPGSMPSNEKPWQCAVQLHRVYLNDILIPSNRIQRAGGHSASHRDCF